MRRDGGPRLDRMDHAAVEFFYHQTSSTLIWRAGSPGPEGDVRQKYGEAALQGAGRSEGDVLRDVVRVRGHEDRRRLRRSDHARPVRRGDRLVAAREALLASLGCGNPTALAELAEGEMVLDLGSGGGIDVLLSAHAGRPHREGVRPRHDRRDARAGAENAGEGRASRTSSSSRERSRTIPLPDDAVDVIISNCVINLSGDKRRVLREAFRVLKPGGRFAVSDVVVRGGIPDDVRRSMELWVGCVAGALEEREFEALLREAGFEDPSLEPTRIYEPEDARSFLEEAGLDVDAMAGAVEGRILSAFVRARKPAVAVAEPCCGPSCCSCCPVADTDRDREDRDERRRQAPVLPRSIPDAVDFRRHGASGWASATSGPRRIRALNERDAGGHHIDPHRHRADPHDVPAAGEGAVRGAGRRVPRREGAGPVAGAELGDRAGPDVRPGGDCSCAASPST